MILLLLASRPPEAAAEGTCPLCRLPAEAELVVLSEGDLLAAATALADENAVRIARIDARFRRGAFGDPSRRQAREKAHRLARVSLPNLYHYLFRFADDRDRAYETGPGPLARVAAEFVEPLLFPVARLQRVRMGRGRACVQYDLRQTVAGRTSTGGRSRRFHVTDVEIEDHLRRVLAINYQSASAKGVEILVAEHYSFEVAHVRVPGPPAPYDLFVVHSLDGVWVRHHGIHRPEAFAYWVSSAEPDSGRDALTPLAGVRIYFPGLRFKLPSFLPDIDLEDLRTLSLPMPFLPASYVRGQARPRWLEVDGEVDFEDWVGVGPLPAGVRARFPNEGRPAYRVSTDPPGAPQS
jgi:hypothetical protein